MNNTLTMNEVDKAREVMDAAKLPHPYFIVTPDNNVFKINDPADIDELRKWLADKVVN